MLIFCKATMSKNFIYRVKGELMDSEKKNKKLVVFTIGHSTRTIDDFISLLREHEIEQLIDIRTIPKSRHNPQFNQADLTKIS